MGQHGKIALYRETLDKTLASSDLTDEKKLQSLVKDQILRSSARNARDYIDNVLEKRTTEVSTFLEMLRSATNEHDTPDKSHQTSWKLKQDTEEFRVMYREGPVGSPLHSLLVEGYIDAPLDVCLCVSWETALYPRWFPDMHFPTFKVVAAKSLQKVMIGEQISLLRTKLSWPMSSREAILHYFAFEFLEDDLVIVVVNTIPDVDNIQVETHGFSNEGIPDVENTVRMDLIGGFALQRVTENRSYFRTIGNLDVKLDFVPPSLINFISRQVIGSGFRFYQKTVASVANGDKSFAEVLSGPLYCRIREALLSNTEAKNVKTQNINDHTAVGNGKRKAVGSEANTDDIHDEESRETYPIKHEKRSGNTFKAGNENLLLNGDENNGRVLQYKLATEIEEEDLGGSESVTENKLVNNGNLENPGCNPVNLHTNVPISPQVEKALGTLDKMINVVREGKHRTHGSNQPSPRVEAGEVISSPIRKKVEWTDKQSITTQEIANTIDHASTIGAAPNGLRLMDGHFNARGASPDVTFTSPVQNSPMDRWSQNAISTGNSAVVDSSLNLEVDSTHENNKKKGQSKKWRFCCLHIVSGRLVL